jgi:hypothetical protein
VYHQARFGYTDFRSVDMDMSAVVGAVADAFAGVDFVADVAVAVPDAAAVVAVAIAVLVVAGPFPGDLRVDRLDRIASIFYVVSCPKMIQSGSKSFAWSEW